MTNATHLILEGDDLDRGSYAMTLFKIIKDYSPRKIYAVSYDTFPLKDIYTGEFVIKGYNDAPTIPPQTERSKRSDKRSSQEKDDTTYTGRLHHLDNAAFVMAVTGSWGTGKTTFVDLFSKLLINDGILEQDDATKALIENNKYKAEEVIRFNAWENDFYDDPMIPFSRLLIEAICGKGTKDCETVLELNKEYMKSLKKAQYEATVESVMGILSSTPVGSINNSNMSSDIQINDIERHSQKEAYTPIHNRIEDIQRILSRCISKKSQQKVIVIVDELDRCKPTFAIQLLEIVKHLFNIRGLVFIFALDMDELQHCVKTVYGQAFDAIGYLERFFDYNSVLPKGNDKQLFEKFAKEYELPTNKEKMICPEFYEMCHQFSLTPREMKGLCAAFYYLNKYELEGYPLRSRFLYFYILLLKHKNPTAVQILVGNNTKAEKARKELFGPDNPRPTFLFPKDSKSSPFFDAVLENKTIKETIFSHVSSDGTWENKKVLKETDTLSDKRDDSWSNILFANDLENGLSSISHLHILEFLFNRIETYGSSIPVEKKIEGIQRGSVITFGRWHKNTDQDMEPIEWIVLEVTENTAFLITRYVIDCIPYNYVYAATTWEESSLHKFLNEDFYNKAFSEEEKKHIDKTDIPGESNYWNIVPVGPDIKDHVFLLSIEEAVRYFGGNDDDESANKARMCLATEYAKRARVDESQQERTTWWWLRSPGYDRDEAACVCSDGSVIAHGDDVHNDYVGVRPALRINL